MTIPVVGAVSCKGTVIARVIQRVDGNTLQAFVRASVSEKVSLLASDQWIGYHGLDEGFPHEVINHAKGQYVVGAIHTNTIEGFRSKDGTNTCNARSVKLPSGKNVFAGSAEDGAPKRSAQ